jgi:hypothetical protein
VILTISVKGLKFSERFNDRLEFFKKLEKKDTIQELEKQYTKLEHDISVLKKEIV